MRFTPLCRAALLSLGLLLAPFGHAQVADLEAAKRADIEALMVTMKVSDNMKSMSSAMMQSFLQSMRKGSADLTHEQVQAIAQTTGEVFAENYGIFHELMVHLYNKHFSASDIQELRGFYASDIGKKLITVTPALTQESFQAGAEWGRMLAPLVQNRVKERLEALGVAL